MNAESNETLPVSEKYMLTIKAAAAYFNIGIKKLRRIAEDNLGTVAVYCGNRFIIIRPKFEEFILNSSEIQFLLFAESSCYFRGVEGIYDEPNKPLKTATFGRKECDVMAKPNLGEKDILNPSEAIEYFVLSRRKFYDLLKNTDGEDFLAYYGERKLIIRVAFEKYLLHHPELRRQV